jgi:hypothetical protein
VRINFTPSAEGLWGAVGGPPTPTPVGPNNALQHATGYGGSIWQLSAIS